MEFIKSMVVNLIHKTLITTGMLAGMVGGVIIGLNMAAAFAADTPAPAMHNGGLVTTMGDAHYRPRVTERSAFPSH